MNDIDITTYCKDDAAKWASEFCKTCEKLGIKNIDEGWMIGWFANAIETSYKHRIGSFPGGYGEI